MGQLLFALQPSQGYPFSGLYLTLDTDQKQTSNHLFFVNYTLAKLINTLKGHYPTTCNGDANSSDILKNI